MPIHLARQTYWKAIEISLGELHKHSEEDVKIRVPIAIARSGMRLGALLQRFAGDHVVAKLRMQGLDVDFTKLDPAAIETVLNELGEANIEVDSGKAQIRIT